MKLLQLCTWYTSVVIMKEVEAFLTETVVGAKGIYTAVGTPMRGGGALVDLCRWYNRKVPQIDLCNLH